MSSPKNACPENLFSLRPKKGSRSALGAVQKETVQNDSRRNTNHRIPPTVSTIQIQLPSNHETKGNASFRNPKR